MTTSMQINYQTMTRPKEDEKDSVFINEKGLIRKPHGFSNLTTEPHNITLEKEK